MNPSYSLSCPISSRPDLPVTLIVRLHSLLLITARIVVYTAVPYEVLHSAVQVQLVLFIFAELPLKLA